MATDDSAGTMPAAARELVAAARRAQASGRAVEAIALLERALQTAPDAAEALQDYTTLALQAGRHEVAAACARHWTRAHPGSVAAHTLLGVALRHGGRLDDALASLGTAVQLAPEAFEARINYGNVLLEAGRHDAARVQYEQALALHPQSAAIHNNLGNLHRDQRRPEAALAAYRRAVALDPAHALAWNNIGNILRELADTAAAIAAFDRALALAPDRADIWSNRLLTRCADDRVDAAVLAEEHRAFGRHFAARVAPLTRKLALPLDGRRLRVGFVSADFRRHAVATFFLPFVSALDRGRVEAFCYYNRAHGDETTARVQAAAEHFTPVAGLSDAALAARIRADGIDVLVDLGGHTADNRLPLFFMRAAPLQLEWLGYLGATGVPAIAWRVSDRHADPVDVPAAPGLEPVWRMPRAQWCYAPYAEAAAGAASPPSLARGHVTFGCFNQTGKMSPTIVQTWVTLLQATPASRLVLLATAESAIASLRSAFAAGGIAPERLTFTGRLPVGDYLRAYGDVDIALDTWPYGGGTTTADALWMGVPVVTLASDRPFARSGASILAQLQLDELVTSTPAGYVECARTLAGDSVRLAALRAGLRGRMQASSLLDAQGFAVDFTAMLDTLWTQAVARDAIQVHA